MKLNCDEPFSNVAFNLNLRRYKMVVWMFYDNPWTLTIGGMIVVRRRKFIR